MFLYKEHLVTHGIKLRGEGAFITDCLHSKPPILESAFPLHQAHEQAKIWKKMKENVIVCPLQEIRDYYGIKCLLDLFINCRDHSVSAITIIINCIHYLWQDQLYESHHNKMLSLSYSQCYSLQCDAPYRGYQTNFFLHG